MEPRKQISRVLALAIYDDAEGICAVCKAWVPVAEISIDHAIPVSRGGTDRLSNLRLTHRRCNSQKSDMLDSEMAERRTQRWAQPVKPPPMLKYHPIIVQERGATDSGLITVNEAIRRYGTSRRTLWRLHQRGALHLVKEVGIKDTLVQSADLERVLAIPQRMGRPRKLPADEARRAAPAPE